MFVASLVLLAIALLEGLFSLRGGYRMQAQFLQAAATRSKGTSRQDEERAVVIVPCRGLDSGFDDNIRAFLRLRGDRFRLLFVVDSRHDPAWTRLCELTEGEEHASIEVAGPATRNGQKVHNLLHATGRLPEQDSLLVFGDSDIRPSRDWLLALTGALFRGETGAATGFRWYVPPPQPDFGSWLRSAWNAGILSVMSGERSRFGWGGALACRRSDFEACDVPAAWIGSLSDDLSLTEAFHRHEKTIRFAPLALSPSYGSTSLRELLDWSTRQMAITRVYQPSTWKLAWAAQILYATSVWLLPLLLLFPRSVTGLLPSQSLCLLMGVLLVLLLSGWKAALRVTAVEKILGSLTGLIGWGRLFYIAAPAFCNLISLQALVRSSRSRTIEWRGIRYEMISSTETRVLR